MDTMNNNPILFCKFSNTFFNEFSGTFEIIIIEIKPDKYIPSMEFLDNSHCMTSKSEGAVNYDILLCRAYIEAVYILVEEYRDMSKTFFVQIVKKWWMGNKIFPEEKLSFFPLLSNEKVYFLLKIYWQIPDNIYWEWRVFNNLWTIYSFSCEKVGEKTEIIPRFTRNSGDYFLKVISFSIQLIQSRGCLDRNLVHHSM